MKKNTDLPTQLDQNFAQRDKTPLGKDAWIKFQSISLMPGIAKNYRYLLMSDGRLFYAANQHSFATDRAVIFNTPMPDQPARSLPLKTMDTIRTKLEKIDFFSQPVYQASQTRDGSLIIITIRSGEDVHEVWYENVHNALSDFLQSITPNAPVEKSEVQEISDLQELLQEQQRLAKRLKKDSPGKRGTGSKLD